jgi:mRNA interferase MazF
VPIRRGDIYFVNLDPVQGHEQAGTRPVLVVSVDILNDLPLVVIVVVGTRGSRIPRDYPSNVRVAAAESGLREQTVFLCFQVRSLAHGRFTTPRAGVLPPYKLAEVEQAIRYCLGL